MSDKAVMAVDVGTGSARVGLFDRSGALLARAEHPILMHQPSPDHAEHDSEDIWQAVGSAAKDALARASLAPETVVG
ncbi:MAG: FGGY family carbohydrate kinase, partial [Geminicoccaceae bacterium]